LRGYRYTFILRIYGIKSSYSIDVSRIGWDEAFTSQLDNLTAALTTNTTDLQAQLTNEVTARTTRTDSLAQEISDLLTTYQSDIADISAQVSQEASTRSSNHLALAQSVESLAAEFDTESSNTSAALAQEAQARSDADTALTNTVNTLSAQVTTNHDEVSAAITDEAIARVALDESIAGRLEEFNASMTLGWGQIGGEGKPEDGADVTANSQALSDTNARVTAAEGSISTQAESINSLSSGLEGVANLTAETALKTSIESINGLISGQAEQITKLEAKSSGINLLPAQFASFDYITKTPALYTNGTAGIDVNGSGGYGPDGSRTSIRLINSENNAYAFLTDQTSVNNEFHNIPVESGKQYIASAYVKLVDVNSPLATSNIQIAVRHVDVANGYLGYKSKTLTVTPGVTERVFIKFTAFTNAAAAAMRIQSMANSGNGDVYLSFDRVMVEQVSEDQTEPSNWVPGNLNASVVETMQVDLAKAMASYTMALDNNGFVTSLALTNDGSTSAFKVKSSNFSFYDDSGNLILGGGNKFKGTYIENASIPNAAIGNAAIKSANIDNLAVSAAKIANLAVTSGKMANLAVTEAKLANLAVTKGKIKDLAVDTIKIANNAVTVPAAATGTSTASVTITVPSEAANQPVLCFLSTVSNINGASGYSTYTVRRFVRLYRNGTQLKLYKDTTMYNNNVHEMATSMIHLDKPGAGTHTYQIQVRNYNDSAAAGNSSTIVCMLAKK
jgi:hypothetical protein